MPSRTTPFVISFFSDFTLGFSDGLTVPFALTAGLSSLGQSDTVIYAGLAELCAGSISMGIGGYLAALDEAPSHEEGASAFEDEEESAGMLDDRSSHHDTDSSRDSLEEKSQHDASVNTIRRYLEPLALPEANMSDILSALAHGPTGVHGTANLLRVHLKSAGGDRQDPGHQVTLTPVVSGLSISLGYVVGGAIPLLPYFFASTIGTGLHWSIALCLIALFSFGAGKRWVLSDRSNSDVRCCVWEGVRMLVLGSLAAAAAVLCVNLVGRGSEEAAG